MVEKFLEHYRYTLMSLLSVAILIGSGISLGIGLSERQISEGVYVAGTSEETSGFKISSGPAKQVPVGKININTASVDELDLLPGIGPAYAQRIVDYRDQNGPFSSISEIQNVSGIGPKTFEKLKGLITVGSQ